MAHNIHFNDRTGKHSFFSVQQKAWHGLGQIVQDYPTSAEALAFAGLDFTVRKAPNIHRLPDGRESVSDTSFFTYRDDNGAILGGRLGVDYEVVQNRDAFAFFDEIVGGDGILYETAGALGAGERIFITAKLPDYIRVGADDLIEKYLFLTTSHDGFGSITAAFTPVRIVCNNTLNAALRNYSNAIRIRHTQNAQDRLKQAHKVLGLSNKMSEALEGVFNRWAKVRITDAEVKKLVALAMCPNKETLQSLEGGRTDELSTYFLNTCDSVLEYAQTAPSQQESTTKGTLFGAYNTVAGYFQNARGYKDGEAKFKSIIGGTAQIRAQKAFDLCADFSASGADALRLS